jgi:C4-dicarboxylate-specific signal transduction histidine kinase
MKASSSCDRRHGSDGDGSAAGSLACFEALLERVLAELHRSADLQTGVQAALGQIAAHFSAQRAMVTVPGCPTPVMERASDAAPEVMEEIDLGPQRGVGTAALFGLQRSGSWTNRDARQLRIASRALCEALCRQSVESELREQQIWLVMAMESASVGVWDWDLENDSVRFLSQSDEHGDTLRVQQTRASEEVKWFHPEDRHAADVEMERAICGETDTFSRVVRQRLRSDPDGQWHHLYSRGRVIERDAAGRARRIMGTYEDVTEAVEKSQTEKAREAAMARAARLASLGVLASSLAHDLNQPLTALTSYLEGSLRRMSKGQATDADTLQALERSVSFAHRASEIVRSFRRLLQREAPMREVVELSSLLLRVRDRMQREGVAAEVEIAVPVELEPVAVRADELQIEQVLSNLVRNAIEALAGSGRRPRVVTLDLREAGGLAEIRVADNGPGISDDVMGRLFEPLATGREAGRGLGLAISRSIAEIHGGRLRVERTGPEGTTFVLALPNYDGGCP